MLVEKAMARSVKVCRPEDSLVVPAMLMWENDIGCVPVVDQEGTVISVITDRDICMAAYTSGRRLEEVEVAAAMARTVFSVRAQDQLSAARELMRQRRVRRVPVVDAKGKLVGMLALHDLVRISAQAGTRSPEISPKDVAEILASIGQPRIQADA
jgi:CBS domain-containing protein